MDLTKNETLIKIEYYMKKRGYSLYKLAQKSDVPYTSLNNLFNRNNEPTIFTLRKICNGLGITLSDFFADEAAPLCMDLSDDEMNLVIEYRSMKQNNRNLFMTYAYGLNQKLPPINDDEEQNDTSIK